MKKLIAMILVLALAVTSMGISVFAYSDERSGTYRGANWSAYLNRSGTVVSSRFTISTDGVITTKTGFKLKSKTQSTPWWHVVTRIGENTVSYYEDVYDSDFKYQVLDAYLNYEYKTLSGRFYA